jgi:hypothetical protein
VVPKCRVPSANGFLVDRFVNVLVDLLLVVMLLNV